MYPFNTSTKRFRMDCNSGLDQPIEYTWSRERGFIPHGGVSEGPTLTIPDLIPEVCVDINLLEYIFRYFS